MSNNTNPNHYDVVIAGGGPGGAVASIVLARAGLNVCVLEKSRHPRFHIGESFLPRSTPLLRGLGLEDEWKKLPHVPKLGAEFGWCDDFKTMQFSFTDGGLLPGHPVFNIERSVFDRMLIEESRKAGAHVFENTTIKKIVRLERGRVELATDGGVITGNLLLDASGHSTLVARHLGNRRNFDDPHLQKVAYFQHFEGVERLPGDWEGHPSILMADEGWFWVIPLNETKTSVGFVTRPSFVKQMNVPADRLLQWAIARSPVVRHRMRDATGEPTNQVLADFSYTCAPYAGPGYFLVGDAGAFLDPIFSTGVTLAMMGGNEAAKLAIKMLREKLPAQQAEQRYDRFVKGSTFVFWRLIRNYYRQGFRDLFVQGQGPFQVHRAVISVLAGQVFPKPVWALRWRLRLFELCVWLQDRKLLAPSREPFKLADQTPNELPLNEKLASVAT